MRRIRLIWGLVRFDGGAIDRGGCNRTCAGEHQFDLSPPTKGSIKVMLEDLNPRAFGHEFALEQLGLSGRIVVRQGRVYPVRDRKPGVDLCLSAFLKLGHAKPELADLFPQPIALGAVLVALSPRVVTLAERFRKTLAIGAADALAAQYREPQSSPTFFN